MTYCAGCGNTACFCGGLVGAPPMRGYDDIVDSHTAAVRAIEARFRENCTAILHGTRTGFALSAATESIERVRSAAVHAAYETPEPDERVMVDAFAAFFGERTVENAGRLVWAVAMVVDREVGR